MKKDASSVRILGVHLMTGRQSVRVGSLLRDPNGNTKFVVDESYVDLGPARPVLSLGWHFPGDEERTTEALRRADDKIGRSGSLPTWFSHVLPEGALRELILVSFGWKGPEEFDLLAKLGEDLPGGVAVRDEGAVDLPAPFRNDRARRMADELPPVKFSLGGLQLKFSMVRADGALTFPGRGRLGDTIVKLASERYPDLPEVEFTGMRLARAAGVQISSCLLVPVKDVTGIPERLLFGQSVLAVDRFDRSAEGGRVHFEEFAQALGVSGVRKYDALNQESVFRLVRRFSGDARGALLEALRRFTVNLLLGNGDAHLKNWAFRYPDGRTPELSPAYDIVPTIALDPGDQTMALKLRGTRDYRSVSFQKIEATARVLGLEAAFLRREVATTTERAADLWPAVIRDLPIASARVAALRTHWETLALTAGARNAFRGIAPAQIGSARA
jgi:serine/threonine-protein kinase HipA